MKNKLLLTLTSFLLAGALVGCTTQKASEESRPDSGDSSGNPSSEIVPSSDTSSEEESSEESSEPEEITLEALLEEVALKALEKRCAVLIPEYAQAECLGPNIYFKEYIGEYASYGQTLMFVNEQGYFYYSRANDEEEFVMDKDEIDLDPTIDIYMDVVYSVYDVVNDDFADLLTLNEEKEDSFLLDIDATDDSTKGFLATILGYTYDSGSNVTAAQVEISKDASELTFTVTIDGTEENTFVTEFGTHINVELEEFVASVPEYVPPVVPEGFDTAIAKIEEDGSNGVGKVVASTGVTYELLSNDIYYKSYSNGAQQLIFNHDGYGYNYVDQGSGFEVYEDPQAGGYDILNSFYTLADVFDGYFADAASFEEETETAYVGSISIDDLGYYALTALASLGGYNSDAASYIDGLAFSMAKDGTSINITVTLSQADIEYTLAITNLGNFSDAVVETAVAGIIENLNQPE